MGKPGALHGEESGYLSSLTGHVRPCHILDAANNLLHNNLCIEEKNSCVLVIVTK